MLAGTWKKGKIVNSKSKNKDNFNKNAPNRFIPMKIGNAWKK